MKITNRQYAFLAWLFEYPVDYEHSPFTFRHSCHARKVEKALVEKGLVKIVKYDNSLYISCLEDYKKGYLKKEELQEWKEDYFQNTDKVWAYRQWMTHEEYAERILKEKRIPHRRKYEEYPTPHPLPTSFVDVEDYCHLHWNMSHDCVYPSLTEEGVVAVIRKFGMKSDSKLEVSAPEHILSRSSHKAKWRVEWKECF